MSKLNQTVREYLNQSRAMEGFSKEKFSDQRLFNEYIAEAGHEVSATGHDEHRWYTQYDSVREFEPGLFVAFTEYTTTGDGNMWDYDLEYDIAAVFVERKTKFTEVTYYE